MIFFRTWNIIKSQLVEANKRLPPLTRYTDLHLDFGEKDFDWKYSKKTIPVYLPEAELVIRPGFQHCGYMAAHPKEYAEEIEAFIWRNRNVLG